MPLPAGVRIGPFEIEARLDLPGLGEVYRARDHERERQVVIQVIRADFRDADLRGRFERDMRAAASLSHPGVLEIHDVGVDAGAAYVVCEPLAGETLRSRIDRRGLSLHDAARCAVVIGSAMLALRRHGIGHPGLSAGRIFLTADGRVLLLGSGLQAAAPALAPADARPVWRRGRAIAAGALVVGALAVLWPLLRTSDSESAPRREIAPVLAASAPSSSPVEPPAPASPAPLPLDSVAPVAPPASEPIAPRRVAELPPVPAGLPAPPPMPAPAARPPAAEPPRAAIDPGTARGRAVPRRTLSVDGRDTAALVTEAGVLTTEFDLEGARDLLTAAAGRGDAEAEAASLYIGGILAARQSFLQGGSAESLAPVHDAITALAVISRGRPGAPEIARLMLHAAAAAAQSEREEMRLYLETATQMEAVQQAGGFEGAPLVSAAELAGELWLQVHQYDEAQRAFKEAATRRGTNLRILAGLARTARRLGDAAGACAAYRTLAEAWSGRPALPLEIAEARAYLGGCAQ